MNTKLALITGGSRGLGRDGALHLADRNTDVIVTYRSNREQAEAVVREGFDCVLRIGARVDSSLVVRKIGRYRVINCASREYVERCGLPLSIHDLAEHRLVHYVSTLGSPVDDFDYIEDGEERSVPMRGVVTVDNSGAYLAA